MEAAVVCPKCHYARQAGDAAPAWQCPSCGIAYSKYAGYLRQIRAGAKQIVVPPGAADSAPAIHVDGSVWLLAGANALAIAVAYFQGWRLGTLMLLYWGQSIAIGVSYVLRILALEKFSTEGFRINGRPAEPVPATKWRVAAFFTLHYGLFHAVYLMFIAEPFGGGAPVDRWFWLCVAAFALNHLWSYRYNRDLDRRGTPNIGTLMFTPYLRVIPMHLTIIGGQLLGRGAGLLLFGGLKTIADVAMHAVEHRQLAKVRPS